MVNARNLALELHNLAENLNLPEYLKNDVLHSTSTLVSTLSSDTNIKEQLLVAKSSINSIDTTLDAFDICERPIRKKSFHLKKHITQLLSNDSAA